jgi:serine/threonine protein kinase
MTDRRHNDPFNDTLAIPRSGRERGRLSLSAARTTGPKLEDFRILAKLGEGTFSEVLKARHKHSGQMFAMKVGRLGN